MLKEPIILNKDLNDFIIGSLLGDASISRNGRNYLLQQSSKYYEYLKWMEMILNNYGVSCRNNICDTSGKKNNHMWYGYHFSTLTNPTFNLLRNKWYPNGKKIVPKDIIKEITPFMLLKWYVDDGTIRHTPKGFSIRICSHGFTREDNNYLSKMLHNVNINSTVRSDKEKWWYLNILPDSRLKFFEYIGKCPEEIGDVYGYKWPTNREIEMSKINIKFNKQAKLTYRKKEFLVNEFLLKNKTGKEIADELGVSKSVVNNWINRYKLRQN
jgi:hypothetical protein